MYDIEKYYQAKDVADCIRALREDPDAVIISGGSDVLIKIREGKMAGCSLVSIHGIPELEGISMEEDGTIVIGPATTFSHITNNDIIKKHIPILGNAVDQAGGPQLRNIGTIGGNVCNGVTSADSASSLFALNAVLELTGPDGVRLLPIQEFYTGPGRTVREHAELLTAVRITRENYEGFGGHYIKYGKREAMEIATMGCAVYIKLSADKTSVEDVRIAFGVAAPTPMRCTKTEERVKGMALDQELLNAVGKGVLEEVNPRTSWRASREFRLQLIEEMSRRALAQAVIYAGGEIHA
ncbi:xanthine dehydrogenase subunit XdhB [Diplocloster modestus]|uniref:Xanthine dehydrogenase FAD-binding subunit XdhB n=1 Tax=Diplocloster modestus TaxID=2850322 RepID=A0ABS6K9H9_9FIRM|nr:xanthine dehydrogenase subunit XdhB [Diplocloster modestus]MBU9727172.1 xanthine dehydrogenase FAD-binding subunit XdhB [Diplocloster modestus]